MPDVREFQFVVDEAERAARAGDFARADQCLREALGLQEASLGGRHPDLASTLNNLAVVSETLGQYEDAERCYRRAYAIASGALPPSDPLVVTSRENLKDFCAARGLPLEDWPGLDQADVPPTPAPRTPPTVPVPPARAPLPQPPATAAPAGPRPRRTFGAVAALAAVGAVVAATFWRGAAPTPAPPAVATTVSAPAPQPAAPARMDPPAEPVPLAPPPAPAARAPEPAEATPPAVPAPAAPPAASVGASAPSTAARPDDLRLVAADVCASLTTSGAWRCEPLGTTPATGRAAFYTRIASPRPVRVEHRWYQGAALRQRVTLSLGASPSAGYRTFSRQTLTPGAWRVELRAADGTVLHEAAFDVR